MVQFKYTVSSKGRETSGVVEAESLTEAGEKLQEQGGYILELRQRFSWGSGKLSGFFEKWLAPLTERMGAGDKILFTRQLGSMLKTGLSITKAIDVFVDEKRTGVSVALRRIKVQLESGKKLSEALASTPKVFDKIYINIVKSGETMGKLSESLTYLGEQLKREYELKTRVKSAMIYPIVVLIAMVAVMSFIAISVVPKIVVFAKNAGAELPMITQVIVRFIEFIEQYWLMLVGVLVLLGILGFKGVRTRKGRQLMDAMWLRVPVLGKLVRKYNQARFARLLSGFYRYGISVDVAFDILTETLSSYHYSEACKRLKSQLMLGRSLSEALSTERDLFPSIMERVVKGAEQTGALDDTMLKLAVFYEEELETALTNLTAIIEPILIMMLGVGVIGIALSVIVPIYRVTSSLR